MLLKYYYLQCNIDEGKLIIWNWNVTRVSHTLPLMTTGTLIRVQNCSIGPNTISGGQLPVICWAIGRWSLYANVILLNTHLVLKGFLQKLIAILLKLNVSLFPYIWSHILQYVKYTKWINIDKGNAKKIM